MKKSEIFEKLEKISKDDLIRALCDWNSSSDLEEFVEFCSEEQIIFEY